MAGAARAQSPHTGRMNPAPPGSRGRLSAEHRAYILEAHANHESIEVIAERLGRSLESIRKVVGLPPEAEPEVLPWELDDVLDFLAGLPEEAMDEILQLSRLERQANHLRQSLSQRLQGKSPA